MDRGMETMRSRILAMAVLLLVVACAHSVLAVRADQDVGIIEGASEGKIAVEGSRGLHVFESVRACTWCQPGVEVVVTFSGFGRATLKPSADFPTGAVLDVLIVRDGRY
jgi:hypothetical protein